MIQGLSQLGEAILMEIFMFAGKKGHYTIREYQKKVPSNLKEFVEPVFKNELKPLGLIRIHKAKGGVDWELTDEAYEFCCKKKEEYLKKKAEEIGVSRIIKRG